MASDPHLQDPSDATAAAPSHAAQRQALRHSLLQARRAWAATDAAPAAQTSLQQRVFAVLAQLEPVCLGVFWPLQGEFNPMDVALMAKAQWGCRLALPHARRSPVGMHFRLWDGAPPAEQDECGIPTASGGLVEPDVVLVPCVGFTRQGWRLGYGGGYFDRFLAAHPQVTAIGVAWDIGELDVDQIQPEKHDQPLMAVITESNTWGE